MARIANKDTAAEMAVRKELHRRGLRYRVNRRIPDLGRVRPDIVFPRERVAVFVDGCFWHQCPEHATYPRSNADWWTEKLARNVTRDRETDGRLADSGWAVVRVWEHLSPKEAADEIELEVKGRRP
jgi:DNA mismatch endonuclease (patch repair protein)